jgi:hypothetical protein
VGPRRTIELVALDVAGTTVDEHGDVYEALRDSVVAEGAEVTDALVRQWMGTDKREAIAALVAAGGGGDLDRDGATRPGRRPRSPASPRRWPSCGPAGCGWR